MIQINKDFKNNEVHIFLWLFAPILIFLIFLIINQLNPTFFSEFFQGEKGFIENGTFFILLISIITNFSVIKKIKTKEYNIQYFLMIIFLIGLVYFAGEEISWGQHWFNWETNNFFKNFNDQSETNFHNMSSWFDQKPRFLLIIFVILGGIILPLYFNNNKNTFLHKSESFKLFCPTFYSLPSSFMCLFIYSLDNLYKILCHGTPGVDIKCKYIPELLYFRTSEILEFYISFFLLIYILSINSRLKK